MLLYCNQLKLATAPLNICGLRLLTKPWTPLVISKMNQQGCNNKWGGYKVIYRQYLEPHPEDHDQKNMRLNRPMSPHLDIFAPTLPAMTSIVQRIGGVCLVGYYLLLSAGTLCLADCVTTYCDFLQDLDMPKPVEMAVKFIIAATFWYHYFNGVRFCAWNAKIWLNLKGIYSSSYISMVLTLVMSTLCAMI